MSAYPYWFIVFFTVEHIFMKVQHVPVSTGMTMITDTCDMSDILDTVVQTPK